MIGEIASKVGIGFLVAIFTTVAGLLLAILISVFNRRPLYRFFGITQSRPSIHIYLSRLQVKKKGTVAFEEIDNGYSGPAINILEYQAALLVVDVFKSAFVTKFPSSVRRLLQGGHAGLLDVESTIDVCPSTLDDVAATNLLLVGGQVYNLATKHYLGLQSSVYYFAKSSDGERVIKARRGGFKQADCIPGRSRGQELGIIQRLRDPSSGALIYVCAGIGASATYGCVAYLARYWEKLHNEFGRDDFGICLAFPGQSDYDADLVAKAVRVDHYPDALDK